MVVVKDEGGILAAGVGGFLAAGALWKAGEDAVLLLDETWPPEVEV